MRSYLHNYPFIPENVEIEIYFFNRDGFSVAPGEIVSATARNGKLHYSIENFETKHLQKVCEETLRICRNQDEASVPSQEAASQ